ncbi:penicillin-binding protein [Nibrella saemangeumensis]|uniref:Penicillin-binding protein n=1 Tax=Nibrella saemangeumensis TaxID=1084526 RepID=A0ABP8NJN1_9BACT
MNIKQDILRRATQAYIFIIVVAVTIVGRLVHVQFFQQYKGKYWSQRIDGIRIKSDTLRAKRGNIYAADGNSLLATSLPFYEVGFDPHVAKDKYFDDKIDSLSVLLARMFKDRSTQDYKEMLKSARDNERQRYVRLSRRLINYQERQEMRKWPFFRSTSKVAARGGVLRPIYKRYHPFEQMAKRTIGDLNPKTGRGLIGLEASYQTHLAGKDAVGTVEILAGGVPKPVGSGPSLKPEPGHDLITTLDVNFQDIAETALRNALDNYQADKGCVIVMEVATGEIRAMANLTRYTTGGSVRYLETFNHALAGRTDPGSTFKLATMMALLEEKAISPEKKVNTGGGSMRYHGLTIADASGHGSGILTARQVFEKSSNVGIHLLMRDYFYTRPETYCRYLNQFRLTKPTGIQMQGEATPFVRNPNSKGWSKTSLAFMAYGYEMAITPLQMLTFYNAVANNGKWVRPMIVKQIRLADEVLEEIKPYTAPEPICSPQTAKLVREMLEGVVTQGTAKKIQSPNYRIAGKTGTAQKIISGRYQVGRYYTSFIGYFPADKPKYSCITVVDNPHGDHINALYGGSVAAPVFREVADRIYGYDINIHEPAMMARRGPHSVPGLKAGYANDLHIIASEAGLGSQPATEGWVRTVANGNRETWRSQETRPNQVPDVRGLTLRDALHLLENRGLRVSVQGRGKVTEQSIEPGMALSGIKQITLTLE